jgi:hypothetical protein
MNFRIKDPKQVVLHASGGSGAGFIDGVWHGQPPKREWVGLTDAEIHDMNGYEEDRRMYRFARAIEAKLREKNTW